MTCEGLYGSLCSHEHRMDQRVVTSVDHAFQSKVNITGKGDQSGKLRAREGGKM